MEKKREIGSSQHIKLVVKGIVQGVGFRPFVYNLAKSYNLNGYVKNTDDGVIIEIEGHGVEAFIDSLSRHAPPLSDIQSVEIFPMGSAPARYSEFSIVDSKGGRGFTLISPDVSVCEDCLMEMMDKRDRRYLYPFINCTNCGPRYTITEKVPYDRQNTTMRVFTMCAECDKEYNDPSNRRFHAQPNACQVCGPSLQFEATDNAQMDTHSSSIEQAIRYLQKGKIIAVKGLGGFHISCNALDDKAVKRLREEKRRNNKPFALMAPDIMTIERYCYVSEDERELLLSAKRPIVLLKKRPDIEIPESVAPGNNYLGFILPYTPLHYLLFKCPVDRKSVLQCLVMTSGNLSEEPIVTDNEKARNILANVVDGFLMHDREIFMRTDDSVGFVISLDDNQKSDTFHIRRARGYVPEVIPLELDGPEVLGVGADLKNTFTLTKGRYAIPSQHIGDMENYETLKFFEETLENLKAVYRANPVAVGHDMHPDYLSTRWALQQEDIKLIPVQHHHAHIVSVMAEFGLNEKAIGVVFDGTGYGPDGNLWGGEFFISDVLNFKRVGHFRNIPLIGGESSIKHPWKTAVSFIQDAVHEDIMEYLEKIGFVERYGKLNIENLLTLSQKREFCPLSSGAGRVFDAVSAMLGVCDRNTFEGEAPMTLESCVREGISNDYPVDIILKDPIEIDFSITVISILNDFIGAEAVEIIAARYHNTIVNIILKMASRLRNTFNINKVVLSGGTFQNRYLVLKSMKMLKDDGFEVFINRRVPCNDACISLGQAYVVREKMVKGQS